MTTVLHALAVCVLSSVLLGFQSIRADTYNDKDTPVDIANVCNSLTGPFCLAFGNNASYARHMTPILPNDVIPSSSSDLARSKGFRHRGKKNADPMHDRCFFRHYPRNWMDNGGDEYDLTHREVRTVDECEQLCCENELCQSYTFWKGHTCYLRGQSTEPRSDGEAFSATKLTS